MLGTACGSDDDESSGDSSSGNSSSEGNAVIDEATANVETLANPEDFTVEPLSGPVPPGKVVAQVNCTIPQCTPGAMQEPVEALGWTLESFDYDITKGTPDYLRAVDAALASKPDYLAINVTGSPDLISRQLEQAQAEGIPVIASGAETAPGIALMVNGPNAFIDAGTNLADVVLADAGEPVDVAMPFDPVYGVFVGMSQGMEDRLGEADAGFERIDVSLAQPAATNVSAIVNYLKANPDTKYLAFAGTAFYPGIDQGLRAAGLSDSVKLVMGFPFPTDLESIQDGAWVGVVAGETTHQWRQVDGMARLAVGDPIADPEPSNAFQLVTQENASEERFDPPNYADAFQEAWGV
ncbi:sugar ABC transporter substrate-binding protein [Trujillonella endophytica]|uniref:sugar ABC transporter substrate-binding protein n=1 Tax=Trujillonella endophytica TaxID=673521 RepID=UPI00147EF819|nr:substrate-binding domain-containing protein [Trujillella endophytica]